nr:immunoglobulin heavy chain junction region [Mus musculus]
CARVGYYGGDYW